MPMVRRVTADDLHALSDRIAIGELVARYAAAVDDRDVAAILEHFTEDASLVRPPWRADGRAELEREYRRMVGRYDWTFHAVHGHAVDLTGPDEATGFVVCHAEHSFNGEVVVAALRYRDVYRRIEGRWLFASRTVGFAYVTAVDSLRPVADRASSVRWPGEEVAAYDLDGTRGSGLSGPR
jgi:ketosteroid isomerase-like protein